MALRVMATSGIVIISGKSGVRKLQTKRLINLDEDEMG